MIDELINLTTEQQQIKPKSDIDEDAHLSWESDDENLSEELLSELSCSKRVQNLSLNTQKVPSMNIKMEDSSLSKDLKGCKRLLSKVHLPLKRYVLIIFRKLVV